MNQELKDLLDAAVESRGQITALFHLVVSAVGDGENKKGKGLLLAIKEANEKHAQRVDNLLNFWRIEQLSGGNP